MDNNKVFLGVINNYNNVDANNEFIAYETKETAIDFLSCMMLEPNEKNEVIVDGLNMPLKQAAKVIENHFKEVGFVNCNNICYRILEIMYLK